MDTVKTLGARHCRLVSVMNSVDWSSGLASTALRPCIGTYSGLSATESRYLVVVPLALKFGGSETDELPARKSAGPASE